MSDISGYPVNLEITAWASFCALVGRGQIRVMGGELGIRIPFLAFRFNLVINLESPDFVERIPIARSPCGQSASEMRAEQTVQ